jgi:hypothetical protein
MTDNEKEIYLILMGWDQLKQSIYSTCPQYCWRRPSGNGLLLTINEAFDFQTTGILRLTDEN